MQKGRKKKRKKNLMKCFLTVNPALELGFLPLNGEDREWTEAELDAERQRARVAFKDAAARTTLHNHPRLDTYDVNTKEHSQMSL